MRGKPCIMDGTQELNPMGLENRRSGNASEGSNPSLSANFPANSGESASRIERCSSYVPANEDGAKVGTLKRGVGRKVGGVQFHDWTYIIGAGPGEPFKVGYAHDLDRRLAKLQAGNHRRLIVLVAIESTFARDAEARLHAHFRQHSIRGEWFHWCPEVVALIADLIAGKTRQFRAYHCTGNVRSGETYHNFTAKLAAVDRKVAAYQAKG